MLSVKGMFILFTVLKKNEKSVFSFTEHTFSVHFSGFFFSCKISCSIPVMLTHAHHHSPALTGVNQLTRINSENDGSEPRRFDWGFLFCVGFFISSEQKESTKDTTHANEPCDLRTQILERVSESS